MAESRFNIFEAIGSTRQEVRHSDFLAFLLDPAKNHKLEQRFLKAFLLEIKDKNRNAQFLQSIDVNEIISSEVKVMREQGRIDILIVYEDKTAPFVIAIENKIDSKEHGEQLTTYIKLIEKHYPSPRYKRYFLYLSPDGHKSTNNNYLSIDYKVIIEAINRVFDCLAPDTPQGFDLLLAHYREMLLKHVLIKKTVADYLRQLIQQANLIMQPDERYTDSDRIGFIPKDWESEPLLHFYFYNENPVLYGVQLYLYVASDNKKRSRCQQIFNATAKNEIFKISVGRKDLYTSIYQKDVLQKEDFNALNENEILKKIEDFWYDFGQLVLPEIQKTINSIIQ